MEIDTKDIRKISLWANFNQQFKLSPFDSDDPVEITKRMLEFSKLIIAINKAILKQLIEREKIWKRLKIQGEKGDAKLGPGAIRQYKKLLEWLSQYDKSEERIFMEFEAQKEWIAKEGYFQD